MRIRVTIEYDYEGGETDPAAVHAEELDAWANGNVTYLDVVGCGQPSDVIKVEVV